MLKFHILNVYFYRTHPHQSKYTLKGNQLSCIAFVVSTAVCDVARRNSRGCVVHTIYADERLEALGRFLAKLDHGYRIAYRWIRKIPIGKPAQCKLIKFANLRNDAQCHLQNIYILFSHFNKICAVIFMIVSLGIGRSYITHLRMYDNNILCLLLNHTSNPVNLCE